jgi:hypothetical protein
VGKREKQKERRREESAREGERRACGWGEERKREMGRGVVWRKKEGEMERGNRVVRVDRGVRLERKGEREGRKKEEEKGSEASAERGEEGKEKKEKGEKGCCPLKKGGGKRKKKGEREKEKECDKVTCGTLRVVGRR